MRNLKFLLLPVLFVISAEARVFNFKDESVAAYFSATVGDATGVGSTAFTKSSGTSTVFASGDIPSYSQSYEMGVVFAGDSITMKLGAEVFQLPGQSDVNGVNASSQKLFDVTSAVSILNPHITFEFDYSKDQISRGYIFAGAGFGSLTIENAYEFEALGLAAFPGVTADYTEKLTASLMTYHVGGGYEKLFTDNVTYFVAAGYRVASATDLKYAYSGENITSASGVTSGSAAKTNDGVTNRGLNMSGAYIGVGFRFYIETL